MAPTRLRPVVELFGRDEELTRLDEAWNDPGTHVVTLVAGGGVGKTSLVAEWVALLAARGFDGARYFGGSFDGDGSFDGQGAPLKGGPSSDAFVAAALRFFGDPEMADSPASAWDKGVRLAELVAVEPTLLVLDGLESLQHPPGPLSGQLQDPAISTLLQGLADKNPGLCVVTTEESVVDLRAFRETTAPEWPLRPLSISAGVSLLRRLGVQGPEAELEALVDEVEGNALTLDLLGGFLVRAHSGGICRHAEVDFESHGSGHVIRVLDAYVAWLGEGGGHGQGGEHRARQLAVLRLLGLFDHPASDDGVEALRAEPAIPGLTEPLVGLGKAEWNLTLSALVEGRLIAPPEPGGVTLDTHPLIREYFAKELRHHWPEAWSQAHGRLFDHLRRSTEHRPDTLEGLQPLYRAVRHGCVAGRHEEACDDVFYHRILRGSEGYSVRQLGAYGSNLGAIASFFESPWGALALTLSEGNRTWLLDNATFYLRALGRLSEAVEPMRLGARRRAEEGDWEKATGGTSRSSQLGLTLGDMVGAVNDGERALDFANRSGNRFWRIVALTTLADAQYQAGKTAEALASFREAESEQAEHRPENPLLYSLAGYGYCDLLLAEAERVAWSFGALEIEPVDLVERCNEVEQRAVQTLAWAESSGSALNLAFDDLTLGRVHLYQLLISEHPHPPRIVTESAIRGIRGEIDRAVDGFRQAGTRHHIPRALLTRAFLRSLVGDPGGARADLDKAWGIAERGPMGLHRADIQLHRARLFHDRDALAEARRLIEQHGYGRRIPELEDAESVADSWPG